MPPASTFAPITRAPTAIRLGTTVLAVVSMWLVLGPAEVAGAHAAVVSTNPPAGSVLDAAPAEVIITFTEPVTIQPDSVVVVDADGTVVSEPASAQGLTISAPISMDLAGWHAVSWSAVSTDGHPISGAWTFRVGEGDDTAPDGLEARAAAASRTSDTARWSFFVSQWASTLAIAVLVGTMFVIALVGYLPRLVPLALGTAAIAAVTSVLAAGSNGPYSAVGNGWFAGPASGEYAGRAILAATVLVVAWGVRPRRPGDLERPLLARASPLVLAAIAFGLPVLSGHAANEGGTATMAVMAHLAVAGCWLGAIPAMYLVVRDGGRHHLAAFSRAATWLLAGVLVAGGASVLLLTGGLTNATQSWGWALFAKFGLLGVAIAAGAWNRWRVVPQVDQIDRRNLTVGMRVEAVTLVLVIAASVAMTHNGPPRERSADGPLILDVRPSDNLEVQLIVDPARVGTNDIHLFVLGEGDQPIDAEEVAVTLSSPELEVGPIEQTVTYLGAGHYTTRTDDLGRPGEWQIDVTIRPDPFTQSDLSEVVQVRP
jgi:copper transport protein